MGRIYDALRDVYAQIVPRAIRMRIAAARHHARHAGAEKDLLFQQSVSRLEQLRDSRTGETAVILGNGPSMRGFDLSRIDGLPAFCLNRGYLLWNDQGKTPEYLVAVNELVIEQFAPELLSVGTLTFMPWLHRALVGERTDIVFFEERWDDAFFKDATEGLSSLATVTNTTLQLAYHMGFKNVILLGIDHYFSAPGKPNAMVVQPKDDADHFSPDYFPAGTRWHLPDLEVSERGYRLAKRYFERDGRRIVNATPGTRLEVFDHMTLEEALSQFAEPNREGSHA